MTQKVTPPPLPPQPVADAPGDNWVDRFAPDSWLPYLRLARVDRPIGVWLLLFPCWWSLALAEMSQGVPFPNLWSMLLFAVGAFVMRAAGCSYNDYVDRDFDAQVARTKTRPIPSGQVSPSQALYFTGGLSLVGLLVLLQFNVFTIFLGAASLLLVAIYPYMKRFTNWPQITLGLAFNWGTLVGWSSAQGSLSSAPIALYLGSVLWTVGYDTIYAHQDKEDDLLLGLKSTAIRFGEDTKYWIGGLYGGAVVLWVLAAYLAGAHLITFLTLALICLHFAWQVSSLNIQDDENCLSRFRSNRDVGAVFMAGLLADLLLSWLIG